jgi:hypothetical protein
MNINDTMTSQRHSHQLWEQFSVLTVQELLVSYPKQNGTNLWKQLTRTSTKPTRLQGLGRKKTSGTL